MDNGYFCKVIIITYMVAPKNDTVKLDPNCQVAVPAHYTCSNTQMYQYNTQNTEHYTIYNVHQAV